MSRAAAPVAVSARATVRGATTRAPTNVAVQQARQRVAVFVPATFVVLATHPRVNNADDSCSDATSAPTAAEPAGTGPGRAADSAGSHRRRAR